jgi:hypothetical protein
VFEVTAQIGEGGMGQVYRAHDTTLNRDVALKILPDTFASDLDRLARFTREAQTLASLNHPNIAQINNDLKVLSRMFSLAIECGKLAYKPRIPLLKENNARAGFFDFAAGEVRLDPGATKNDDGRVFLFTVALRELLEAQHEEHERLKKAGHIEPRVFVQLRGKRGSRTARRVSQKPRPIGDFKKTWDAACRAAGCPGRIVHDFRRTAVRNLVRPGIPERVAMQLTGQGASSSAQVVKELERETGIEPATSSLGSLRSTAELLPRAVPLSRQFTVGFSSLTLVSLPGSGRSISASLATGLQRAASLFAILARRPAATTFRYVVVWSMLLCPSISCT